MGRLAAILGAVPAAVTSCSGTATAVNGTGSIAPPLPVAPRSAGVVTTSRPLFRWRRLPGSDGARVEVCRDRQCTLSVATWDAGGDRTRPSSPLPAGVLFWRLTGRAGNVTGLARSATWAFVVPHRTTATDGTRGTIVDLNGDGLSDVAVLVPSPGTPQGLSVTVIPGRVEHADEPPPVSMVIPLALYNPAISAPWLSAPGDMNGDGYADLGALRLFHVSEFDVGELVPGGPGALSARTDDLPVRDVASAGDLDGDGYGDTLVTVRGAPAFVLGRPNGALPITYPPLDPSYTGSGLFVGYIAGRPGDFNGDGVPDVVLVPGRGGVVNIHPGHADGTLPDLTMPTVIQHVRAAATFDSSVATPADVDGDGYEDLVIAPPSVAPRQVLVFLGGDAGLDTSASTVLTIPPRPGGDPGAETVVFVTGAGDLNGDGYPDVALLLSASATPDRVVVLGGGPAGLSPTPILDVMATDLSAQAIADVAGMGDTNGDGIDDLALYTRSTDPSGHLWITTGGNRLSSRDVATFPDQGVVEATHVLAHAE